MGELAEIFRIHGAAYRAKFGDGMPASPLHTMRDIEPCRTEALGGQFYSCQPCGDDHYSSHSCKNRHCPKCQNDSAETWQDNPQSLRLPVPYFMVTFPLPAELRALARLAPSAAS